MKARLDAQVRVTHLARLERAPQHLASMLGRRPYTTCSQRLHRNRVTTWPPGMEGAHA